MNKKEAEKLQPGNIIRKKNNPEWAFIVSQNFGDHIIAIRTIELRVYPSNNGLANLDEWEVIAPEPVKEDDPLEDAAHLLHEKLKNYNWYSNIGIAAKSQYNPISHIVVYTKLKKYPKDLNIWMGYPVEYNYIGIVVPLGEV